jgi:hypothetical protein
MPEVGGVLGNCLFNAPRLAIVVACGVSATDSPFANLRRTGSLSKHCPQNNMLGQLE